MFSPISSKIVFTATCALAALNSVSALSLGSLSSRTNSGINCDGSAFCVGHSGDLDSILAQANTYPFYENYTRLGAGQQFAQVVFPNLFYNGLCATVDTDYIIGPSTNGQKNSLADVVKDLIDHKCNPCGSAPLVRTGNDLSKGALTVNYCEYPVGPSGPHSK